MDAFEQAYKNGYEAGKKYAADMFAAMLKTSGELVALTLVADGKYDPIYRAIIKKVDKTRKEIVEG
jgi:hypothetical protein